MTSLGYSEYIENGNNTGNGNTNNSKLRRNTGNGNGTVGGPKNRTLKAPKNDNNSNINPFTTSGERGIINSSAGITNENGNNNGTVQQAGNKVKQIKEYIENIHRKGGEDSDLDEEEEGRYTSVLPSYPAQGMGIYSTNTTKNAIIRSEDNGAGSGPIPSTISSNNHIIRKTTQLNSLNPSSAYSSTLLEGIANNAPAGGVSTTTPYTMPYGENGRNSNPLGKGIAKDSDRSFSKDTTSTYAKQYYEQFVPYAENLANQLSSSGSGTSGISGTNIALMEKLNYIIHMLEEKKDEKTGHVIEELILYCFLGIFIIFVVDTFTKSSGMGGGSGGGGGSRYRR
jgi:hypothetical protein